MLLECKQETTSPWMASLGMDSAACGVSRPKQGSGDIRNLNIRLAQPQLVPPSEHANHKLTTRGCAGNETPSAQLDIA